MSKLIISCGLSAVGKSSFFQKAIPRMSNVVYLVKDSVNDGFVLDENGEVVEEKKPDDQFYLDHIRIQSYKALFNLARDNLKVGRDVVIDGYFTYKVGTPDLDLMLKQLDDVPHDLRFVYFHCSKDELRRRTEGRNRLGTWEVVKQRHLSQFDERYAKASEIAESFPFNLKLDLEEDHEESFTKFREMMGE